MCILCVIQKWSRRVATMLPWLVIPLIGLWALSQLLPPAFRFEITSPRLACVSVLLFTLFWYEVLVPQLSAWRVRRNAWLRDRKRSEAIELQKLRKTATRKCRNCLTPYKDQNPGGGKFMCSYCGHISKRPVLDMPPGIGISNPGIIKDLVGKSGKILNGKAWSDNGWKCSQEWLDNGGWAGGSISGKSSYWRKNGSGIFGGDENCLAEKSYSGVVIFSCKLLTSFFLSIRWLWRKVFRITSSEDGSSDAGHRAMLAKRCENGENYHESRGDKARRKAEEKRQARLEKELLEHREHRKSGVESVKGQNIELTHGIKNTPGSSFNRGNAGSRYFDRMKGTFLSSSRAFSGGGFFGKAAYTPATVTKENKPISSIDPVHVSAYRRDVHPPDRLSGKASLNGDDKHIYHPVLCESQPRTAPKKTWQQLFTRSSPAHPSSNANVICRPISKQAECQAQQSPAQSSPLQSFDNPINFGLPSPFPVSAFPNVPSSTSLGFSPAIEPKFSRAMEGPCDFIPEEPELFEDPCYIPDPISLLGPVSESLDNFQLDLGNGFAPDTGIGLERLYAMKNVSASPEVTRPSPIESPLSRQRTADEKNNGSNWFSTTPISHDFNTQPVNDMHVNETGTWQMWNSSPLGQDGLGLVGGPGSWLSLPEQNRSTKEDIIPPPSHKTMASLFTKDDQILPGMYSPQKTFLGNGQSGVFSPVIGSSENEPWLQNTFFPPLSGSNTPFSLKPPEESTQSEMIYQSPTGAATNNAFGPSPVHNCSKNEWGVQGSGEGFGNSSVTRPNVGGLFSTSDVQWSFD
ncbi:STRESS RESPONSE PROTEIN NST1-RELATED [Salix purpurea]|uniref:STRESS RESPONSE PROTEIN NST1-RELATED n=1 Tax=Salix purpurea TaxID=77065 RepID=A0A9Q0WGW9_SALPP|nr:STRESS RESPONSE PROTEIN NST1-RELATED [Salix purpurea]